ncbi:hypothetical protein [Phenylobacterium sp.]|jgi:hypothetical protein|uniref:hypothetical protein n=1 Tax=Phenylobacterium sp. TaxID=1871053 RepID=UPI002730C2B9|nr:hypothetical protein [Phenylobacterium sp.]MDP1617317.1 hypothetical protein [Phenylobacterium sp.]MDP1985689.1 hypothetical protein [Phenylobacterium sp.]
MSFPTRFQVHVTDHAVVRWLERVEGHDIELVRQAIRAADPNGWIAKGAAGLQVPALGVRLVARDGSIVTVEPLHSGVR